MTTERELLKKHRDMLDEKFLIRYPEGQFCIQKRNGNINLYVNFRRRTSYSSWLYPHAFGIEHANSEHHYFTKSQNNSFGRVTYYNSFDKFLRACQKLPLNFAATDNFMSMYLLLKNAREKKE